MNSRNKKEKASSSYVRAFWRTDVRRSVRRRCSIPARVAGQSNVEPRTQLHEPRFALPRRTVAKRPATSARGHKTYGSGLRLKRKVKNVEVRVPSATKNRNKTDPDGDRRGRTFCHAEIDLFDKT